MSFEEKDYRRYKGILFTKEDIYKITGISSLELHNIKFTYRFIAHLYKKAGFSKYEIADMFSVNINFINKILSGRQKKLYKKPIRRTSLYEEFEDNPLAISLRNQLGNTTFNKLLNIYNCSSKDIKHILKKTYRLWHKLGTLSSLSYRLNICISKVSLLINFIKEHEIIKDFKKPRKKLTKAQKYQIIKTKELYDELKTLSNVGKKLGLTRERVRQILERGDKYGIIDYKPSFLKRFDDVVNNLKKEDIEKFLLKYGSKTKLLSNLKDKYKINMRYLDALITLHNIDLDYLILQHKKNKCISEYSDMVRELGLHPTTTIMAKRQKWRALWTRITRIWGNMDNFRREFGIPIPKKGNPRFKEIMKNASRKRVDQRQLFFRVNDN